MFHVIVLSYLFMHFSKSVMIHMKETCCPCLVKIHVNKLQVASWPCSLLILCHVKVLVEDQCQVLFHLANLALLALFGLWSAAYTSWYFWSSLQVLFFYSFCILKYVLQPMHGQDHFTSKIHYGELISVLLMYPKLDKKETDKWNLLTNQVNISLALVKKSEINITPFPFLSNTSGVF